MTRKVVLESSLNGFFLKGEKGRPQFLERYSEIEKGAYDPFKLDTSDLHPTFLLIDWVEDLKKLLVDLKRIQAIANRIFRNDPVKLTIPEGTLSGADLAWFLYTVLSEINRLHYLLSQEYLRMGHHDVLRTRIKMFERKNSSTYFMASEDGRSWHVENDVGTKVTDLTEDEYKIILALIENSLANRANEKPTKSLSGTLRISQKDLKFMLSKLNDTQDSPREADLLLQRVLKMHNRRVHGWIISEDSSGASGRSAEVIIEDKTLVALLNMSDAEKKRTKSKSLRNVDFGHVSPS